MPYITRSGRRDGEHRLWRVALTYALCERHGENYQVGTLTDAIRLARQKNAMLRAQAQEQRKIGG